MFPTYTNAHSPSRFSFQTDKSALSGPSFHFIPQPTQKKKKKKTQLKTTRPLSTTLSLPSHFLGFPVSAGQAACT